MKTEIKIQARAYAVTIRDERTGYTKEDTIVLDKARLQAAQLVGMNDDDLIYRAFNRKGYRVLDVAKPPRKMELVVDLEELLYRTTLEQSTERKFIDLSGDGHTEQEGNTSE